MKVEPHGTAAAAKNLKIKVAAPEAEKISLTTEGTLDWIHFGYVQLPRIKPRSRHTTHPAPIVS